MRDQGSLFSDERSAAPRESLEEINHELLQRAQSLPAYAGRVFVFGEGAPGSQVAVVGESPGAPDIDSGRPFMGPAGQMLDRILLSINLRRPDCYLTNTVKMICQGDEITPEVLGFFTPFLHREMDAARPRVIIAFGNTPTRALLGTKRPISQMRGEFHDYHGIQLMPTFNPAYLLRDPSKKREAWEDIKKVRDFLAAPPPNAA